ncbi:hypothetical protein M569_12579, partial [Genlisea aurea]
MGGCCSCHVGRRMSDGVDGGGSDVEEEDVVMRGPSGARIRLQGSSKYISMFTQQGKKGINQDAMTVWENFSGDRDMFFCGVFDGHGPSGHKVAKFIRDSLPAKISAKYLESPPPPDDGDEKEKETESQGENPSFDTWKARLIECYNDIDEKLEGESSIESYCSGTTSVCVLKKGHHLVIANLGDSRAVVAKKDDQDQLIPEQLTVDLKPNLPEEANRIRNSQGRVLAMDEEPHIFRIWMPHEDCPGLAMARAFGDFCLKDFGLISTPQVTYRRLNDRDEFLVLATDGIWDALSNEEVVRIVGSARKRSSAAKSLVERAIQSWRYKFPRARIDDCAAVILFFTAEKRQQQPALTKSASEVT